MVPNLDSNKPEECLDLGATMAILYGQITTNKPVIVKSSVNDAKAQDII